MRGFQSLFCIFLRLSLYVCFLRYFLRCFLSSAVSLGVSFAWCLCVLCTNWYVSMCISLCVSLCVSLCLFVSLYIFPCIKKKQEGESRGSFFSLCGRTFRCSPKYGHFLYLNSKEETATHLRLTSVFCTSQQGSLLASPTLSTLSILLALSTLPTLSTLAALSTLSKPRFLH